MENELDYKLEHLQLMKEEGISKADLPKEIQNKIGEIKRYVSRNKNTEKMKNLIIKKDIELADLISNWKENEIPEQTPEQIAEAKAKADAEQQTKADAEAQAQVKADAEQQAKADAEAQAQADAQNQAQIDIQVEKIKSNTKNGRINTNILKEIIGKTPSQKFKIGELSLQKVYLASAYHVK